MTEQQSQQLLKLQKQGCVIKIHRGPYVDDNWSVKQATIQDVEEASSQGDTLKEGEIFYESDVYDYSPLSKISVNEVSVFKKIENWQNA